VTPGVGGVTGPRGAVPRGATPGRGGRRGGGAEGYERWEFWWEYNKEPFLNLKQRIHRGAVQSGSSDFFLGGTDKDAANDLTKATEGQISGELIPGLIDACSDKFFDTRAAAVIGLGKTRDKAKVMPTIVKLLADEDKQVRESAALALGILGDKECIPILLSIMQETPEGKKLCNNSILTRTRAFAAVGLGLVKDEAAIQPLLAQLQANEKQKDVPICAAIALGVMGEVAKPALPDLTKIAQDKKVDDFIRAHVVSAIAKIRDKSAIPTMQALLQDDSLHVLRSAVQGLGILADSEDTKSINLLIDQIEKSRDTQAKNWSLISLGRIGGPTARKALLTALQKEQRSTQAFAALGAAIAAFNSKEKDNSDGKLILDNLRDVKDPSVKGAMCIALGIMEYKDAEEDLVTLLTGKESPDLRGYAAVALGLMQAQKAKPHIKAVLKEKGDPDLQRSSATALGLMSDREAIPLLVNIMKDASTEFVISSAALALGFIGDSSAVKPLLAFVKDTKTADLARANATSALGVIGDARDFPPLSAVSVDCNYRALVDSLQELLSIV
jgi:HEAT repeat protein